MRKFLTLLPLVTVAMATMPAHAQNSAPPADAPATAPTPAPPAAGPANDPAAAAMPEPVCELHIWPAARVSATTQGAGAGFGLIGALIDASAQANQNKRDTAFITGALDAQAQARALRDLDLPTKLHLPPSRVIMHDQGIDLDENQEHPKRLSDSVAPCYSEFVVRGLRYFANMAYKAQMRTFMEVRLFDGPALKTEFRDSRHENLVVKLPREGDDIGPATDALIAAFRGDVVFFTDKYTKKKT